MKVEIINPDEAKKLFSRWGKFASVCYDTKTNSPESIGKHCMNSGHFSGSRSRYIEFKIEDVPRFVIDQCVRASVGVGTNVQSFRYVNKDCFCYEIPKDIKDNDELLNKYIDHMEDTIKLYEEIQHYVLEKTGKKERANEQARYVLPMATHSAFVIGFSLEALIHYMNVRLCTRTEDVHRKMAMTMKDAVLEILPELKDKLVPNCQKLIWCPEGKMTCGAFPTKEEVVSILKERKGE